MNTYSLKRAAISIIYPNRCPFCGKVIAADDYFCPPCLELDFYDNFKTGADSIFCCIYNDKSKPLLAKAKEHADGFAISAAAKLMYDALRRSGVLEKIDVITPVPARKVSMKSRGYSFPALLAKEIAALSGKKYSAKALILTRETEEQKDLNAIERIENLKGAFGSGKLINAENILIIDDVSTTGATLNEAKRVLSEHYANVYTAAFAKV